MTTASTALHPCQRCGACCAAFVVAFHWSETLPESLDVPLELAGMLDPHRLAMHGTHAESPRCVALQGEIGHATRCTVYPRRPSPCRAVTPAWESGAPSAQCDRARLRHGLPPLSMDDWVQANAAMTSTTATHLLAATTATAATT